MKWILLMALSSVAGADATVPPSGEVQCKTADDCWLDDDGTPIKRPKKFRGKPHPRGDCKGRIMWLRNRLYCEDGVCKTQRVGDRCELPRLLFLAEELGDLGLALDGARPGVGAETAAR